MSESTISFVLDEKIKEIDLNKDYSPTTTVLNYLRLLNNHKGVKEGCAEGDCGACTVVIAELKDEILVYKAINSCLVFLPYLHGKQLITVENLAVKDKEKVILHPVQQAMLDMHGSQCGYCTPGIVMSLFAIYKNFKNPSIDTIKNNLEGNLCRCTGYQPILDAAVQACTQNDEDYFSKKEKEIIFLLKKINKDNYSLTFNNKEQKYFQSFNIAEVLDLIKKEKNPVIINGATDIALKQTKNREILKDIVDISAIKELKFFNEDDKNYHFGAGLSIEEVRVLTKCRLDALHNMLNEFASQQIRNIATIGGNIATASPISDTLPLLFAYKASLILRSSERKRTVFIEDFIKSYRKTDLKSDEIIESIVIPVPKKNIKTAHYKISKRKSLDISTVSAGISLELEKENNVKEIILAFGGMAAVTKRAVKTEKFLNDSIWNEEKIKAASEILMEEFVPISDARSNAEFRKKVCGNILLKFFYEIKQ